MEFWVGWGDFWVATVELGLFVGVLGPAVRAVGIWGVDEPESLILAQSERWRHA